MQWCLELLSKLIFPCATRLVIDLLRTSSAMQNRRGDKGSPCLTPLLHLKYPICDPLMEMDIYADSRITCIQLQNALLKPYAFKTLIRKYHFMVSNALAISTLK